MHSITMNWEYRSKISFFVWGKIMHANGLDMSLSIADIYGTITVEQSNLENTFTDHFTNYRRSGIVNSIENLKNYKHHEAANY